MNILLGRSLKGYNISPTPFCQWCIQANCRSWVHFQHENWMGIIGEVYYNHVTYHNHKTRRKKNTDFNWPLIEIGPSRLIWFFKIKTLKFEIWTVWFRSNNQVGQVMEKNWLQGIMVKNYTFISATDYMGQSQKETQKPSGWNILIY